MPLFSKVMEILQQKAKKLAETRRFSMASVLEYSVYILERKRDHTKLLNAGIWSLKARKYNRAKKLLKSCIKLGFQLKRSLKLLGIAYRSSGDYERAIKTHKKCLNVVTETDYAEIFYLLGEDYEKLGDIEQAKSYYKESLERDSTRYKVFFKLADIYIQEHKFSKAIKLLLEGLKIQQKPEAWIKLAMCYIRTKKLVAAKKIIEQIKRDIGENEIVLYLQALYFLQKKDYNKTEELCIKLKDYPELEEAIKTKMLLERKEYKTLKERLDKIEKRKRNGDYWYLKAVVEEKLGNEEEARKAIKKALKMQPELKMMEMQDIRIKKLLGKEKK